MNKLAQILILGLFCIFTAKLAFADDLSELRSQVEILQEKIQNLETARETNQAASQTPPPVFDYEEVGDRLNYLEDTQDSMRQHLDDLVRFNMYVTLEYENFENTHSAFDAKNVEFIAESQLGSRLKGFMEVEFERAAKTSAGDRQGEIEVEQGWLEYRINEYLNLRAGVITAPFGKFNTEHFETWRDLTQRPIAMRRVVPVTWAEAGAGFTGNWNLGENFSAPAIQEWKINYQVYLINGLTNDLSDTGIRDARGAFGDDNNNNKAVVGRIGFSPAEDYEIGISGYFGAYDDDNHDMEGFDIDWDFNLGDLELIGEYAHFKLDPGGLQKGSSTLTVPGSLQGGYAQANYHFWFDFLNDTFLGKTFSSPTFTAVLRFGWADIEDDNDTGVGDNKENRWTVGLNYRPVEMFVYKMEYQFNSTDNESLERGDKDGFIASVSAAF